MKQTDVLVVGGGLAGLVAACEAADAGAQVLVLDQEGEQNLGGQAFWSLGGLFLVDSPEQRRLAIRDSLNLAQQDWKAAAGFDRPEDHWGQRWADAYLEWAAGPKREWLARQGVSWFPVVGWAERGLNSVPRFHLTMGTGPGVLAPFIRRAREHQQAGRLRFAFRHRVRELLLEGGAVAGVAGDVLEPSDVARGERSSRVVVDDFSFRAASVILAGGGIGGNLDLVRRAWPTERLGPVPEHLVVGVPHHVDGLLGQLAAHSGASSVNGDRMWHYTEGLHNWAPIWPGHGIRVLPGPSSLWLSPTGERLPAPHFPGVDTLGTLNYIGQKGYPFTWFVLNRAIIRKEFALSGSEQNPDLTEQGLLSTVLTRLGRSVQGPVQAFMDQGADFVVADDLDSLLDGMERQNAAQGLPLHRSSVRAAVEGRDHALQTGEADAQLQLIDRARRFPSEKILRVTPPAPVLDPSNGPLIAVRMSVLTRKSLGGLETNLQGQVLRPGGAVFDGLYAAGEIAGFGGGGYHGYRALEGTFLGGCLFSGRRAGQAAAGKEVQL
ncbi:MAG: FAD-binding dehydrogenase [Deinococcus sp.]|nr:FAD-binding dehydrogenase [Deinococcus sp.]